MEQISIPINAAEKTRAAVAALWARKRSEVQDRLGVLDRAADANPLHDQLRIEAHDVAHKLAGSLGMFGFSDGTLVARELELLLEGTAPDATSLTSLTRQLRALLFPAVDAL